MKNKKLFLAVILAATILCGCNKTIVQNDTETDSEMPVIAVGDETTFKLSRLPDIGKYTRETEPKRWYNEFTDTLIPSSEYGELIPFAGNVKAYRFENWYDEGEKYSYNITPLYGLATKDGTIVVDAVYTDISYNDGYYLLQTEAQGDDENLAYSYYLAKSDGSTLTKLPATGMGATYLGNGIYSIGAVDIANMVICDRDGKLIYDNRKNESNGEYVNVYPDGTLEKCIYNDGGDISYLINKNGDKLTDEYQYIEYATTNKYIFQPKNKAFYGIIDKRGYEVLPSEYDSISYQSGVFVTLKNHTVEVKDENLKTQKSFEISENGNGRAVLVGEKIIETSENWYNDTFYYDLSGKRLDYDSISGDIWGEVVYYTAQKGDEYHILDKDLNLIVTLPKKYNTIELTASGKLFVYDIDNGYTSLYDIKQDEFVAEKIDFDYSDYEFYYLSENGKTYAYKTATNEKMFEVEGYIFSEETPIGKMYFYKSGDYCYTADKDFNTILKIRTQKD